MWLPYWISLYGICPVGPCMAGSVNIISFPFPFFSPHHYIPSWLCFSVPLSLPCFVESSFSVPALHPCRTSLPHAHWHPHLLIGQLSCHCKSTPIIFHLVPSLAESRDSQVILAGGGLGTRQLSQPGTLHHVWGWHGSYTVPSARCLCQAWVDHQSHGSQGPGG